DVRLLAAESDDVLLDQRIAHDDEAVTVTIDEEPYALDRLAPLIRRAMPERHHHVTPAGPQFRVDVLQDRRVESAFEGRDIHADHLCRARQQRSRRLRGAEVELLDRPLHALGGCRSDGTLAAHHARRRSDADARAAGDVRYRGAVYSN